MKTSLLVTEETKPEEVLELPVGRLMIGDLVATFSPDNVLEAAKAIVEDFELGEGFGSEEVFVSQAGVIAYAADNCGWNSDAKYKAA